MDCFEVPEDVQDVAGQHVLVCPVGGFQGDYWMTQDGRIISVKGTTATLVHATERDDGREVVNLSRDGTKTQFTRRQLYDRVFGTADTYSDAKLALDLYLDHELEPEAIADIVPLSLRAVHHIIKIWKNTPRQRARWRSPD